MVKISKAKVPKPGRDIADLYYLNCSRDVSDSWYKHTYVFFSQIITKEPLK